MGFWGLAYGKTMVFTMGKWENHRKSIWAPAACGVPRQRNVAKADCWPHGVQGEAYTSVSGMKDESSVDSCWDTDT